MSYVSRVVIACNADGTFSNAAIHESEVVGGRVYDLDPRAVYAADAALLDPYLGAAGSAAVAALAERDATIAERDATIAERDASITALTSERDAAVARVTELEAQLAAASGTETDSNGIPVRVPMAAGRIALSRAGKLASVKAALAAISGQPGEEAREWFEYSSHIERQHPTVIAMTPLIGTSADVDALFLAAAAIASGNA